MPNHNRNQGNQGQQGPYRNHHLAHIFAPGLAPVPRPPPPPGHTAHQRPGASGVPLSYGSNVAPGYGPGMTASGLRIPNGVSSQSVSPQPRHPLQPQAQYAQQPRPQYVSPPAQTPHMHYPQTQPQQPGWGAQPNQYVQPGQGNVPMAGLQGPSQRAPQGYGPSLTPSGLRVPPSSNTGTVFPAIPELRNFINAVIILIPRTQINPNAQHVGGGDGVARRLEDAFTLLLAFRDTGISGGQQLQDAQDGMLIAMQRARRHTPGIGYWTLADWTALLAYLGLPQHCTRQIPPFQRYES